MAFNTNSAPANTSGRTTGKAALTTGRVDRSALLAASKTRCLSSAHTTCRPPRPSTLAKAAPSQSNTCRLSSAHTTCRPPRPSTLAKAAPSQSSTCRLSSAHTTCRPPRPSTLAKAAPSQSSTCRLSSAHTTCRPPRPSTLAKAAPSQSNTRRLSSACTACRPPQPSTLAKAAPPKSQVDLTALLESCRAKREASERARMARYRRPVSQAPRRPPSTEATPTSRAPTPPGYPSPPTGGPQNLPLRGISAPPSPAPSEAGPTRPPTTSPPSSLTPSPAIDAVPMAIPEASEIHEMVRKHRIYMEDMEEWRHEFNAAMEVRNVRLKALKESYGLK